MRRIAAAALLMLPLTPAVQAQGSVDVSRLPLNLARIQRELRRSVVREERDGLNLRYVVEVYGQAPPIVLFGPAGNFVHGPVPYGGPTHKDMLEQMTPKEYRAPAADFGALLRWLPERARGNAPHLDVHSGTYAGGIPQAMYVSCSSLINPCCVCIVEPFMEGRQL
ncbi:MAG: hypothetical protein EXQ48_05715 [Acidobacteria bacterium]|nr:hypothetical protein [Acidobacteriota bacterium]